MGKLIYFMPCSLDGFIADEATGYDWSLPDDEAMAFMNDLIRPIGTYLSGRKEYQTMAVWETPDVIPGLSPVMRDFAQVWQAADKIVYSKTLKTVATKKTRLERELDPKAVRDLKARLPHDISVAGPNLAGQAIQAGLVDEIQLFIVPFLLGSGIRVLPSNVRGKLELLEERCFPSGWVYVRYRMRA